MRRTLFRSRAWVEGLGFWVQGLGFMVQGFGVRLRVQGLTTQGFHPVIGISGILGVPYQ